MKPSLRLYEFRNVIPNKICLQGYELKLWPALSKKTADFQTFANGIFDLVSRE